MRLKPDADFEHALTEAKAGFIVEDAGMNDATGYALLDVARSKPGTKRRKAAVAAARAAWENRPRGEAGREPE